MKTLTSVSLAVASVFLLAGCSAMDALGSRSATGTYELQAVNGYQVPAVVYEEPGYRLEVLNAAFTLESDGTYSEAGIVRETQYGQTSTRSSSSYGRYDYYNGELTFNESSGRQYYGTFDGNTLVIEDQGVQMEYRRY